jgi:hypothetical protein
LQTIQKNGRELLSHPPYSTDLALSDYDLFGPLKHHLRGHHYETDEAVQKTCEVGCEELEWTSTCKILQRWQKCIDLDGEFVGKCLDFIDIICSCMYAFVSL